MSARASRVRPPPCTCCDERPGCDGACTRRPERVGMLPCRMREQVPIGEPCARIDVRVHRRAAVQAAYRVDTGLGVSLVADDFVRRLRLVPTTSSGASTVLGTATASGAFVDLALGASAGWPPVTVRCYVVPDPILAAGRFGSNHTRADIVLGMDCIESARCSLRSNVP